VGGKYHPFSFGRTISTGDVEISEEMFIITKETAEAYRNEPAGPQTPETATKVPPVAGGSVTSSVAPSPRATQTSP